MLDRALGQRHQEPALEDQEEEQRHTDRHGESVPLLQANLLPGRFAEISGQDPQLLLAILLALGGVLLVLGLEWLAGRRQQSAGCAE